MNGMPVNINDIPGTWGQDSPRIYERYSEGYPTGKFYIDHLSIEHIQWLIDWMIVLPEEMYAPLAGIHRDLERFVARKMDKR